MTLNPPKTGILVVCHGSPRQAANDSFVRMVEKVKERLPGAEIHAGFFSLTAPTIADRVEEMVELGIERIVLCPHFLFNGQHYTVDIPAQVEGCRERFPKIEMDVLETFQDDPAMVGLLAERLARYAGPERPAQKLPQEITARSHALIETGLGADNGDEGSRSVVRRVIHATADFSFARSLQFHPEALARGVQALKTGRPVICDVEMVKAGITRAPGGTLCAIRDADVAATAKEKGSTRSAAAMDKLSEQIPGSVLAIGNAPTALWRIMDMVDEGMLEPALVVGVPVGFVGALESKLALSRSELCYITNLSNRGGSPVAAAIVNALIALGEGK